MNHFLKMTFLGIFLMSFVSTQAEEFGIASYYADEFHGRKTASGELYDKGKMTCAHKSLPFGTVIRVTRLDNKKSITVRVNDRGPFIKGRIVDVSRVAADKLDIIRAGHAEVKIEVINSADLANVEKGGQNLTVSKPVVKNKPESYDKEFTEKSVNPVVVKPQPKPKPKVEPKKETPKSTFTTKGSLVTEKDYKFYDLYQVQLIRPAKNGFGIQVASYSTYENAMKQIAVLQGKWFDNILMSVEKGKDAKPVYKVLLGPFETREIANRYEKDLKKKKKIAGFIVDLSAIE